MNRDLLTRVTWGFALALLALPLIVRFGVLITASEAGVRNVVDFLFDDGYYYLTMAANLADSGHSTLDGITPTNGYQPLWLIVLTAFAKLTGTGAWVFFVASCALVYAIAIVAPLGALAWRQSPWRYPAYAFAAGLAIIAIQQPEVFLEGLEPILFLPLALPLVMMLDRASSPRQLTWLSLCLALAFLVRLDALSLFASAALVLPLTMVRLRGVPVLSALLQMSKIVLRLSVFVVPTVVVYMVLNKWLFDTAVPVSGIAKMIGGPLFSNWGIAIDFFARWKSLAFLLVLLVPLELAARMLGKSDRVFWRAIAIVTIAGCAQYFYYSALSTWNVWPWYPYLVAICMALVAGRIFYLAAVLATVPRVRLGAFALTAVIFAWGLYRAAVFVQSSLSSDPRARAPLLARLRGTVVGQDVTLTTFNQISIDMLGSGFFPGDRRTMIAMGDRAGGLSYWGRARLALVQTEGLTLDMRYLHARLENRGASYLEERYPIEYLVADREHMLKSVDSQGRTIFVVPEPIQGRVTNTPVPTFCFPESAIRYRNSYQTEFGTQNRTAFVFSDRVPCTADELKTIADAAAGPGLRRFSLPAEYGAVASAP